MQGDGALDARVVFLSDLPPADLVRAVEPSFTRATAFFSNLVCGDDWPDVELELNVVWPETIVTVGPVATGLVLGEVDLAQVHGEPFRVGEFVVIPIYGPAPPPWHIRCACDLQTLVRYLKPQVSSSFVPPLVNRPKLSARAIRDARAAREPRLWRDGDLP